MDRKRFIRPHVRRGINKIIKVKGHNRIIPEERPPNKAIINSIYMTFQSTPVPLNISDISKKWNMHHDTVSKYIEILEKNGKIKKIIRNGRTHWMIA